MVLDQLTYSGVFEAIRIRKSGYPFRLEHKAFVDRYRCVAGRAMYTSSDEPVQQCTHLLKLMKQDGKVMMGRTKVLYRIDQHRNMELYKTLAQENLCMCSGKGLNAIAC